VLVLFIKTGFSFITGSTRDGGTVGVCGVVCKGDGSKGKTEPGVN